MRALADPGGSLEGVREFNYPPGAREQLFFHVPYEQFLPNLDGPCGV